MSTGTVKLHVNEVVQVESLEVGGTAVTSSAAELNILDGVLATAAELNKADGLAATAYHVVCEGISFTEAGDTSYTGTVEIPAGAILQDIQVVNTVLWDDSGTVTFVCGDDDDPNGWFESTDMKATVLVVGEVLSAADVDKWGGEEGAYLTSAGRMGRVTGGIDSGPYYGAASEVIGVITTQNQNGSAGRSFMFVTYAVPTVTASTAVA